MHQTFSSLQGVTHRTLARYLTKTLLIFILPLSLYAWSGPVAQPGGNEIDEINAEFHFLDNDDTLLLHEEEGRLKGQIDAFQNEDESDVVLSYTIALGSRHNDHVEFKTAKIHRKYYRFAGEVVRGSGREENDADYLRLVGDLEIITIRGDTGKESVEQKHVILKSLSASEKAEP